MTPKNSYVLIVDDDPGVCEMYVAILQDSGFHSRVAHNGAEALSLLGNTATNPSLIILGRCPGIC
jgi:DNA-binding response OmpR family regulator